MRLVVISDTHNLHDQLQLPAGDALIHCGDFSELGSDEEVRSFAAWLREQPFPHKVLIAGNHDATFESHRSVASGLSRLGELDNAADFRVVFRADLFETACTYVEDGFCDLAGLRVYGSPHCHSKYNNMAFTSQQDEAACSGGLKRLHEALAEGRQPDVALIHGPPAGVLDKSHDGRHCGCRHLRSLLDSGTFRPKLLASGHIHEGYGHLELELPAGYPMLALNASARTLFGPMNEPIVLDWGPGGPSVAAGGRRRPLPGRLPLSALPPEPLGTVDT